MRLLETIRARFGPQKTSRFHLGAFGKHPGWDDHLDDLGLETEALLAAKHFIYNQSIGGALDSGQWESYGENALADFDHLLAWLSGDDLLVGRMWASSDGKGRKRYPMILCAQTGCGGAPTARLPWVIELLRGWESQCRAVTQAAEVRRLVEESRAAATAALSEIESKEPVESFRREFAEKVGLDSKSEAVGRIVYAIESYLVSFAPTNGEARAQAINLKLAQTRLVPQHFRLRADSASPEAGIRFWDQFFSTFMAPATPRLYLVPIGQDWLDLVVGLPTAKHLICLKARPQVMPLVCDIPFSLTPELQERATRIFGEFLNPPGK